MLGNRLRRAHGRSRSTQGINLAAIIRVVDHDRRSARLRRGVCGSGRCRSDAAVGEAVGEAREGQIRRPDAAIGPVRCVGGLEHAWAAVFAAHCGQDIAVAGRRGHNVAHDGAEDGVADQVGCGTHGEQRGCGESAEGCHCDLVSGYRIAFWKQ